MICAIRNIVLALIVLTVAGLAQQAAPPKVSAEEPSNAKAAPSSAAPSSSAMSAPAPDLSESAKRACDPKKGEFWDEQKGCMWIVDWDFGSEPIGIDPQSSTVQHTTIDYELNRLPTDRSIGGILSLP
jgi:hypothetical protein